MADFDEYVRGRMDSLLRVAYLLTGDRHAAEDLLQDTLERLYVAWSRVKISPDAYVRRSLVNGATSRWRRRRRRPETPLEDIDVHAPDRTDDLLVRQAVLSALKQLPARQRAAVVLRFMEDMSIADVAEVLSCSVGTVKSHTSRGLSQLREALRHAPLLAPTNCGTGDTDER